LPSTLTIAALRGKVLKEKVLILSERFLIFSPISDSVELAGIPLETGKSHAIYGSQMMRGKALWQPDGV